MFVRNNSDLYSFIPSLDPKGKDGPNLDEILHFANGENELVEGGKSDAFLEKLDQLPDSESVTKSSPSRFRNEGRNENPFDRNRMRSGPNRRYVGPGTNHRNFGQGRSAAQSSSGPLGVSGPLGSSGSLGCSRPLGNSAMTTANLKQTLLELFPDNEEFVDRVLARDQEETNIEVSLVI